MSQSEDASSVPTNWCNFVFDYPQYAVRDTLQIRERLDGAGRGVNIVPQQPLALSRQSFNTMDPFISIPERLLELYCQYRPTPLRRARGLEQYLKANARIYYKFEGANICGSHKLNSALAQTYYYSRAGVEHLVTGTGAGQWGSAIAYACKLMGINCTVFMVGASLRQKPQRGTLMRLLGATVHESPSTRTAVGRKARRWDTERIGTLAVATGEAIEFARSRRKTRFAVGSGENCVLLHQTVIGSEALLQMTALGEFPDWVVACMGAGSNLAGIGMPFLRAAKERRRTVRLLAIESAACPRLTCGRYAYDVNDFSGTTPISKMYTLGSKYVPPPVYAGGLRYHGAAPFLSAMYADRGFDAMAIDQVTVLEAGLEFAMTECILPAPESAHAVAGAIDLARRHPHGRSPIVILINVSGHGLLDFSAYASYLDGQLDPAWPNEEMLSASLRHVDHFNARLQASMQVVGKLIK
jgi:tryptophan synthase beta chain